MRTLCGVVAYLMTLAAIFFVGLVAVAGLLSPTGAKHKTVTIYSAAPAMTQPVSSAPSSATDPQTHRIGPPVVHRAREASRYSGPAIPRLKTAEKKLRKDRTARLAPPGPHPLREDDPITALGYAPSDTRHSRNF